MTSATPSASPATSSSPVSAGSAPRPFSLGFLAFVEHEGVANGRSQGIDDGLALFELAEELGYDAGFVRARHLETYLSSPLTFLAAAAGRTERLRLGTAVIPLRYEDPVRLAEDVATLDLISGGRVDLGLSAGYAANEDVIAPAYGPIERDFTAEAEYRLNRFRAALSGETLTVADERTQFAPAGTPLTAQPQVPGLVDRVAYGAGRVASARRAGELGVNLQLSTLSTEVDDDDFETGQLRQIEAYRAARSGVTDRTGTISVSRSVLPVQTEQDASDLAALIARGDARQAAYGTDNPPPFRFGVAHTGSTESIVGALAADVALAEADQLVIALPFGHDIRIVRRLLTVVAEEIAPGLGWAPTR